MQRRTCFFSAIITLTCAAIPSALPSDCSPQAWNNSDTQVPAETWCHAAAILQSICSQHQYIDSDARAQLLRMRCRRLEHQTEHSESNSSPKPNLPLFSLHISKTGGTSLCNLMKANNLSVHPKESNCWIPKHGPVWFAAMTYQETTCGQYESIAGLNNLDVIASEAFLDGGNYTYVSQLCDHFTYITMLRSPVHRTLSHRQEHGVRDAAGGKSFAPMSLSQQLEERPDVMSNYMTRVLLGRKAYYSGSNLTRQLSEAAQAAVYNLLRIDVVLILERPDWAQRTLAELGWRHVDLDHRPGRRWHRNGNQMSQDDAQLLIRANQIDLLVYCAAWMIASVS
eukprot:TRINITY_DN11432_c0_g3_i1.p2 TRINITY_DN11432_c0_g3~~TRINITY_DN11432_c0_g3_i1.p2  ORF type:complete len:339 (+),score=16.43 TRINITY_DN11432_c0_g3_i1:61-1077(+)